MVTVTLSHEELRVVREALANHRECLREEIDTPGVDESIAEECDDDICVIYELQQRLPRE